MRLVPPFGISTKLGLVFGGFVSLFMISALLTGLATRAIRDDLVEIAERFRPANAAAYEMEINVVGTGLAVTSYVNEPLSEHRARFEKDRGDFERFLALYRALATTAGHERLAETIEATYSEFTGLGLDLMATRDAQQKDIETFERHVRDIHAIIDEDDSPMERDASPAGQVKSRLLSRLRAEVAQIFLWFSTFAWQSSADHSHASRMAALTGEMAEIRHALGELRTLGSSPDEARWIATVDEQVHATFALIDNLVRREVELFEDLRTFIALRGRLDNILDEEIQVLAGLELAKATENGQDAVRRTEAIVVEVGILGLLFSVVAIAFVSRRIARPLARLTVAADAIGAGNLAYRAEGRGRDEIGRLAATFNDMAARLQQADRQLRETNARLEAEVAERIADLSATNRQLEDELSTRQAIEAELRAAKNTAEVANHAKTMFLANMSHELRTPLNAIIGFAEIMNVGPHGTLGHPKYQEYAVDILDSGQHLLNLINDILDVARIESGQLTLRESLADLNDIFRSCLDVVEWRGRANGVAIDTDVPRDLPVVWIDQVRFKQVVLNLLDNAVKFTPSGGRVTLSARIGDDGGMTVVISDDGPGIAPEDIPRMLTAFVQGEMSLARTHDGAGLGLPLAKSLVELHGGHLRIDSAPGEGTRASFTLPASRLRWPAKQAQA